MASSTIAAAVAANPNAPIVKLDPIESAKRLASHMAVDRHVLPEHWVRPIPPSLVCFLLISGG